MTLPRNRWRVLYENKHGIADWILEVISFLLLAGASLYLLIGWDSFPDKLPMHHNFAGEIDRWGDKSELLFLVVIAWVLYVLLVAVERFPSDLEYRGTGDTGEPGTGLPGL